MDNIIAEICKSYGNCLKEETMHPDYLPDKDEITEIIALLRTLIFPGYFSDVTSDCIAAEVRTLVSQVEQKLRQQICCALNSDQNRCANCSGMYDRAGEICREFLGRLPNVLRLLMTDVQAAFDGDPAARNEHEIIFAYPGIHALSIFRLAHELHLLSVPLIPRMMTEQAHSLTGIDIHPGADIGPYFFIDHGTGVVIGETTKIGERVKLYQGVTLGALSTRGGQKLRGKKRHPTLEDDVTVYSGASILGGETIIGSGCIIGGNVFLTESVPPFTRVYLVSPKLDYREI